ncbi:hypothetical protein HY990_03030 [Candidatus Micrarchaeota archaeon]|nr:hypothetical protein [Candidatus Micrarchaeota archaeon]
MDTYKGQLSLDFLFSLSISLIVVSLFSVALYKNLDSSKSLSDQIDYLQKQNSFARTYELYLVSGLGIPSEFVSSNLSSRIEHGVLLSDSSGRLIQVGGVFYADTRKPI